jgi:predicted Zn-dependent protease
MLAKVLRFALTGLTVMLITGCASRVRLRPGEIPTAQIPPQSKIETTKTLVQGHFSQAGQELTTEGPEYQRSRRIVDNISRASGSADFSYPLYIAIDDEEVNAMAVEGNTIVVYRELARRLKSDDELAAILAHEVAHILAGHAEDNTAESRETAVSVGSSVLGIMATVAVAVAGGGSAMADVAGDVTEGASSIVGTGALVRAYDREDELEADRLGLMLMAQAGYRPDAALVLWEHAEEKLGKQSGFTFLSTHPGYEDRAEQIKEVLPLAQAKFAEQQNAAKNTPPVKATSKVKKHQGKRTS